MLTYSASALAHSICLRVYFSKYSSSVSPGRIVRNPMSPRTASSLSVQVKQPTE